MKKICFITVALISVLFLIQYLVSTSGAAAPKRAGRSYEARLWNRLQTASVSVTSRPK